MCEGGLLEGRSHTEMLSPREKPSVGMCMAPDYALGCQRGLAAKPFLFGNGRWVWIHSGSKRVRMVCNLICSMVYNLQLHRGLHIRYAYYLSEFGVGTFCLLIVFNEVVINSSLALACFVYLLFHFIRCIESGFARDILCEQHGSR